MFNQYRPDDTNIVAACSDAERDVLAFGYSVSSFGQGGGVTNRIGPLGDRTLQSVVGEDPDDSRQMRTTTLNAILTATPLFPGKIGYLNIDCEGHDLEVLKGLDLERYHPTIITIEGFTKAEGAAIQAYLAPRGYEHKETFDRTYLFVALPR